MSFFCFFLSLSLPLPASSLLKRHVGASRVVALSFFNSLGNRVGSAVDCVLIVDTNGSSHFLCRRILLECVLDCFGYAMP